MPVSLKTLQLLQRAGVTGDALREIVASILVDCGDAPHVSLLAVTRDNTLPPTPRRRRLRGVSRAKREEVFLRDGHLCQYCRDPSAAPLTVDHIQPMSKGGSNDPANLATACETCNCEKADMTLAEWEAARPSKRLLKRPVPRKQISAHDAGTVKEAERLAKLARAVKITARSKFPSPTYAQIAEAGRIARETLSREKNILSKARKADRDVVEGARRALASIPE